MTVFTRCAVTIVFVLLSFSVVAGQVSFGPRLEVSIKNITAKAEVIFVGTLSSVEPANDKTDEDFSLNARVKFAIETVLKGPSMTTLETKGGSLVRLFPRSKKFLVFIHKYDEGDFRFSPASDVLPDVDVQDPDQHWEIGVRGGRRLPPEYGPYVLRFFDNEDLWMAGDKARWTLSLREEVLSELVRLDSQFADTKKADDVFSISTRGCHFIKDELVRAGGVGYIGRRPCPLPLTFVEAYVKVLVRQEAKK